MEKAYNGMVEEIMEVIYRVPGYDEYKIGDQFKVLIKPVYNPADFDYKFLQEVIAGEIPEVVIDKFKHYIRLSDGDKLIDK